ncbi:DsbA family protein [Shimia abyssi]|uniref:Protein-disulfide isomerase n=1 Tax=Shimia abyssi TaxID=1662395 RepID=A0A2P8FI04_9RHOB|nr:DsbA family protein [Shimia abyssi]PSL21330.1 protein-disulfide isomerase [Shimia abyssi]
MNRLIPIALVAATAVAGGAYWFAQPTQSALAQNTLTLDAIENVQLVASDEASANSDEVVEMVMGAEDAPITMIEYASFTCPHCASFHENVFKDLKANYIDTGKVKFIFRDVYFDRFGLWAAMVARCGGQERFFGITDLLMESQSEWSRAGDPVAIADALRKTGRLAGLEDDQLQACLQNEDKAKALIAWYQENASADDISGTPTLIINGDKHSNMSYRELSKLLDEKLEG